MRPLCIEWHYGSYYLWGDVPALMPIVLKHHEGSAIKAPGMNWSDRTKHGQDFTWLAGKEAIKNSGGSLKDCIKQGGDWFNSEQPSISRLCGSKSSARKAASAMIAKIPFPLAQHIARVYKPHGMDYKGAHANSAK